MSSHGSTASQVAHFMESLLAWLIGFLVWSNVVGVFGGLAFVVGKEGSQLFTKARHGQPVRGDLIDLYVHLAGFILPALVAWAV